MPILKFKKFSGEVTLENLRLEDITNDKRTKLVDKKSFMQDKFKVDENIYMAVNDLFFKLSKIFNKSSTPISAMMIKEQNRVIIIVPSCSYVFWNGRSVEPNEYIILGRC